MKRDSMNKNPVSPKCSPAISPQINLRKLMKRNSDVIPFQIDSNRFKLKKTQTGIPISSLKKSMENEIDEIHSSDSKNSKPITSLENVENVASSPITTKNDSPRGQKLWAMKSFSPSRTNSFAQMNSRK